MYFASTNAEGIAVHEYGHIFASVFGNKRLETAKRAYYNVYGKTLSDGEVLSIWKLQFQNMRLNTAVTLNVMLLRML